MSKVVQNLEWLKIGQVFQLAPSAEFSHAQVPFPVLRDGKVKVYFASRSQDQFGLPQADISSVEIDEALFPDFSLAQSRRVHVTKGDLGSFFENGLMPGSVALVGEEELLYFTGWSRRATVPYNLEIGCLSVLGQNVSLKPGYPGPILSRARNDPFTQAHPIVFRNKNLFIMLYQSGYGWLPGNESPEILYRIRTATSTDGFNWSRSNDFAVPTLIDNECQTSPTILKVGDLYLMYFAYRAPTEFRDGGTGGYRLGAAISKNLASWSRISDPDLTVSKTEDWDSQMVTYPRFFQTKKGTYLFYCGNNFGKSGFGLAQLSTSLEETLKVVV